MTVQDLLVQEKEKRPPRPPILEVGTTRLDWGKEMVLERDESGEVYALTKGATTGRFECPACGAYVWCGTSGNKRRKPDNMICHECETVFLIEFCDRGTGRAKEYSHPDARVPGRLWEVHFESTDVPLTMRTLQGDTDMVNELTCAWYQDRAAVLKALDWAYNKGLQQRHSPAMVLRRVLKTAGGIMAKSKAVKVPEVVEEKEAPLEAKPETEVKEFVETTSEEIAAMLAKMDA